MKKLISIIGLIGLVAFGVLIFSAHPQLNKVSLSAKEYFIDLEMAQKGLREVENKPKSNTPSVQERRQTEINTYKERIAKAKENIKKEHNKNLQETIQELESAEIDALKLEVKKLENNAGTNLQEGDKLQDEYLTKIKKLEGEVADKFKEYKELFNQTRDVFKKDDKKIKDLKDENIELKKQLKQKPKEVKVEVEKEVIVKSKPEIVIEYKYKEIIKGKDKEVINNNVALAVGIAALVFGSLVGGVCGMLLMKLYNEKKRKNE